MDDSVFRVIVDYCKPNYASPWDTTNRSTKMGSSFCVEKDDKKYILTNYHVVRHAEIVTVVYKSMYLDAYIDKVVPEFDIAIIHVDEKHMASMKPLKFYNKPVKKKDKIRVYGFPLGMTNISITEGIISQINTSVYSGFSTNMVIQISASISNGNSGGPVVNRHTNEVIGIAFSSIVEGQNINFSIPNLLINKSFDKKHDSVCTLSCIFLQLLNPTLRSYYGLDKVNCKPNIGVLVKKTLRSNKGKEESPLKRNDVLISIDKHEVTSSGNILLSKDNIEDLLNINCLIHTLSPDKEYDITIVRDGKLQNLSAKLPLHEFLIPPDDYYLTGEYIIVMGIVFVPVSEMLMEMISEGEVKNQISLSNLCSVIEKSKNFSKSEGFDFSKIKGKQDLIIVTQVIYTDKNRFYNIDFNILKYINGIKIFNINHINTVIYDLIKEKTQFIELVFSDKRKVILDISEFDTIEKYQKYNEDLCRRYINTDKVYRFMDEKDYSQHD